MLLKLIKFLLFLLVVGFVALVVFAYLGEMTPEVRQVEEPVQIETD